MHGPDERPAKPPPSVTTSRELANLLDSSLIGESRSIARLASPATPTADAAVVISTEEDAATLADQIVGVVIGPHELATGQYPYIQVPQPKPALAALLEHFDRRPVPAGISPAAHIDPAAMVGRGAAIAAGAVIGAGATIGPLSVIGAGSVIGVGARIGTACRLHANVTVYDGVTLGDRVILHSGAVIGADGFGYAETPTGARKLRHLGSVRIGNDVEIGANTCVDRGTLTDTVIGDRTKIDNLCQIAHNTTIGTDCLIAGLTGVSGSVRIGNRVILAGGAGIVDHVEIGDGATIGATSNVRKDVPAGETWMGTWAVPYRAYARSQYLQSKLEEIWRFVKERR